MTFDRSTTRSAPINTCAGERLRHSIAPRRARMTHACLRSTIRDTSSSSSSRTRAPSASSTGCSSSPTRSRPTPSASRKSTMASGRSTLVRSYSRDSMNVTTSFAANMWRRPVDAAGAVDAKNAPTAPWKTAQNAVSHSDHRLLSRTECYLCCRLTLLPILPVVHAQCLFLRSHQTLSRCPDLSAEREVSTSRLRQACICTSAANVRDDARPEARSAFLRRRRSHG